MDKVQCSTPEKYAKHGGPQWRSPKYMTLCGCDLAVCENHAIFLNTVNPFGPRYEAGKARKCRKHMGKGGA